MWALLSMQGAAMPETALCDRCHGQADSRQITRAATAADTTYLIKDRWIGGNFTKVNNPEVTICTICGTDVELAELREAMEQAWSEAETAPYAREQRAAADIDFDLRALAWLESDSWPYPDDPDDIINYLKEKYL